jgi:hypothetical protein
MTMTNLSENANEHRTVIEQWGMFELSQEGPDAGNPFLENTFRAHFSQRDRTVEVDGFYDGDGRYRVRFMPDTPGPWQYQTFSNVHDLANRRGEFEVREAGPDNHGPVQVCQNFHFSYADGVPFKQIGTTCYAWTHQGDALAATTLASLARSPFNKLRMCVFPKSYQYNENEPELYPFRLLTQGSSRYTVSGSVDGWEFDLRQPNPRYFQELERRVKDLQRLGIEADLILFHPYDRWGFARMTAEQDESYLRYVVARLGAYRNVWWSVANEYDLMFDKTEADWDNCFRTVQQHDPYNHLRSIHNCVAFYDHSKSWVTHLSVQHRDMTRIPLWRKRYNKPVVVDECGYEGNLAESWGCLTGREMVLRFWEGLVNGGYVGHGDTFRDPNDVLWWAKGGHLKGESSPRLAFLGRLLEAGPAILEPIPSTLSYLMATSGGEEATSAMEMFTKIAAFRAPPSDKSDDEGMDFPDRPIIGWFAGVHKPNEYYLTYFGDSQPADVIVDVPAGPYTAEIVDTWEMTKTVVEGEVVRGMSVALPVKPYQALILRRAI